MTESFTERLVRDRAMLRNALQQFVDAWGGADLWVSDGDWRIGYPENDGCGWTNLTAMARAALAETGEQA